MEALESGLCSSERECDVNVSTPQHQRTVRARVCIGEQTLDLLTLEHTGFTVLLPGTGRIPAPGDVVDWTLLLDGRAIGSGRAKAADVRTRRSGTALRFTATDHSVDPAFLDAHQILADLRASATRDAGLVPDHYKILCADIASRLRGYRKFCDRLDARIAPDDAAAHSLFEEAAARLAQDWKALSLDAAALVTPWLGDADRIRALRAYTQQVVTPELTEGAIWRRAFQKPRGYPGDYGVMNYCYAPQEIGATTYAKLCHRLGIDFVQCVRTRKDAVRDAIRERIERQPDVSVMSIACGSAQEVYELAAAGGQRGSFKATLVDQDTEALEFATARLVPYLDSPSRALSATAVRAQFGDYSDPNGTALPAGHDLVYCFGMFDYLPDELVEGIVPVLYSKLKPGGTLVLGNLRPAPEMIWPLCFVLGYDMWFRTADRLLALAASLDGCHADLKLESTGYNYLLFAHKR